MTLDEQIAWLSDEYARESRDAAACEWSANWYDAHCSLYNGAERIRQSKICAADAAKHREQAATLLTIENTLRALKRHEDALGLTFEQAFAEAVRDAAR